MHLKIYEWQLKFISILCKSKMLCTWAIRVLAVSGLVLVLAGQAHIVLLCGRWRHEDSVAILVGTGHSWHPGVVGQAGEAITWRQRGVEEGLGLTLLGLTWVLRPLIMRGDSTLLRLWGGHGGETGGRGWGVWVAAAKFGRLTCTSKTIQNSLFRLSKYWIVLFAQA